MCYFAQAVAVNLSPVLFGVFHRLYHLDLSLLGVLIAVNFVSQLAVDLLCAPLCRRLGYREDDPCTIGYLRLVRQQLLILYRITGKEELRLFSEKFHHYDRISNILKMYRHKFTALKKLNRL